MKHLVITVIGQDRPGLVGALSDTVYQHKGNWLGSSMSKLAGQFAGILQVDIRKSPSSPYGRLCPSLMV